MKKYTEVELQAMSDKSDVVIATMTTAGAGLGFAPVFFDISGLMIAMGAGVVGIGACYGMKLNKEDAGELIKMFFKSAGITFSFIFTGQKITASLLKSNPITYIPTMIADAVMCGATAYAVGHTSKKYFAKLAMGKKPSSAEIAQWMKDGKKQGKSAAQKSADEKASEYQDMHKNLTN